MDSSLSNIVKWVSCESSEPPKVASLLRSQRFSAAEALHAVFSISPPNPDDRKIQTKWENTDALEERESGEVEKTDGGVEEMTKEKEGQEEEEEEEIQKEGQKEGDTGGWVSEYYGRLVDVVHSIISVSPSSFAVDDPVQLHTLLEATRRLDWSGSVVYLWQVLLRECNTMVEKGVLSFVETVDRVPVGKMNLHGLISLLSESMSFLGLLFSEGIVDGKEPKRFELMWEVAKVRAKKGIPCPTEIISRALTMLTNVQSQEAVGHALHIAGVWVHDMQETLFENAFDAFLAVFRRFLPGINTSSAELESFLGPLRWYLHQLYNRSAVDLVDRLKKEHFEPREKPILCMFMQQLIFHPKLVLDDGSDAFVDHADEQDEEHGRTTNYSLVEPPFETALELTDSLSDEQADPLRNAWRNVKTSIVSKFERDEFVKRMRGYRERINELERQLGVRSPRMRVSDAGDIGVLDEEWMKKINALTIECHAKADEIAMLKELLSQKEKQCKAVEAKLKERNTGYSNMKLLLSHAKYQSSSAAARIVASREVQHEISLWEQYHRVMADIHEEDADLREKVIHLGRQLKNQQTYVDGLEKKFAETKQCLEISESRCQELEEEVQSRNRTIRSVKHIMEEETETHDARMKALEAKYCSLRDVCLLMEKRLYALQSKGFAEGDEDEEMEWREEEKSHVKLDTTGTIDHLEEHDEEAHYFLPKRHAESPAQKDSGGRKAAVPSVLFANIAPESPTPPTTTEEEDKKGH